MIWASRGQGQQPLAAATQENQGERSFGEAALQDRDRLGQALDPPPHRLEGDADGVVLGLVPAGARGRIAAS